MKRVLIVVGEASSDRYAARLVERLRTLHSQEPLEFYGTGGDAMKRAGVRLLCHIQDLASIGPREAATRFRLYFNTFKRIVEVSQEARPVLALFLDFPEFNLRLAKKMKRMGVRVVYYISPQLWAWRSGRIKIVRRFVDKMMVILPFEEDYYRARGIDAQFVGHPLLEDFSPTRDRESFLRGYNLDPAKKTVALLPGSREKEVEYILPTLLEASLRILKKTPAQFVISAAPSVEMGTIQSICARTLKGKIDSFYFRIVTSPSRDVLANADFGFVKSGTSTLEAALVGTPFLIIYRISPLSWYTGKILIRSPFKGLVNLIANEEVVPEFMQAEANPEMISTCALAYLESPGKSQAMRERLAEIRARLSARPATETAAALVAPYLM